MSSVLIKKCERVVISVNQNPSLEVAQRLPGKADGEFTLKAKTQGVFLLGSEMGRFKVGSKTLMFISYYVSTQLSFLVT